MENYLNQYLNTLDSDNTKIAYKFNLEQMLEYMNKDVNDITYGDLVRFKEHFTPNYSSNSMAQKIRCIRAYFDYLFYELEVIDSNPVKNKKGTRIREDKVKKGDQDYFTMSDIHLLLNHAKNARDKAIIAVYAMTGMRATELINLTLEDYDKKIAVIVTKGKKNREILFNDTCQKYIDAYLPTRKECGYNNLFISNQGTPMRTEALNRTLKNIAGKAGLKGNIHNHSLRHTCITEVLKNHDIETAREFIGHSSCSVTMGYVHTTNQEVRNAALGMSF